MPQTNTRPNKILVVDDDVRIRDLLRRYLMQEGFEVMLAEDGKALNRVLREAERAATGPTAAVAPAAAPLPANVPAPAAMHLGLEEGPVNARVVGEVAGWQPGTLFTLDNGQQWQVMKGQMKLRKVLQSPQIAVVPGIAGRWFLQVDEDLPKARVFRVR